MIHATEEKWLYQHNLLYDDKNRVHTATGLEWSNN